MVHRYKNCRVAGFWIDEDLLYRAVRVAEELGYRSFSAFIRDLLEEAVAAYEAARKIYGESTLAKKHVKQSIFAKILSVFRPQTQ